MAAKYAREHDIPYLGICLGMQTAVIEYARDVLGYADANSGEFTPEGKHNVIDLMPEQEGIEDMGGTMRLGAYPCVIKPDSLMAKAYGQHEISERHRHRYEFNNDFREEIENAGMKITGTSPNGLLVEAVEVPDNRFFVAVQYHPELINSGLFTARNGTSLGYIPKRLQACRRTDSKEMVPARKYAEGYGCYGSVEASL